MSDYTTSYAIRYSTPVLSQKTEVAVVTAATEIQNEDASAPDHNNRLAWANWAMQNSPVAWPAFAWPVAQNPAIVASIEADPSGQSVLDSEVQFVVNSYVQQVVDQWIIENPPPA